MAQRQRQRPPDGARCRARAGVELTDREAWALLNFFNGTVFIGLTLPQLERRPTVVRAAVPT